MIIRKFEDEENNRNSNFHKIQVTGFVIFIVNIVTYLIGLKAGVISYPLDLLALFVPHLSLWPLILGIPLFVVGVIVTAINSKGYQISHECWWYYRPEKRFADSIKRSFTAGVFEELERWGYLHLCIFLLTLLALKVPGYLPREYIFMIGVILVGVINVIGHTKIDFWLIIDFFLLGIYMVYLMVSCGIIFAIIFHITYDLTIALVEYILRQK